MDFVSQRIIIRTFSVSFFLIDRFIKSCFSGDLEKLAEERFSMISTNKLSILRPRVYLCILGSF